MKIHDGGKEVVAANPIAAYSLKPLGALIARHVGGGTPERGISSYWNGNIPWASVKDFDEDALALTATQETISLGGLNASASSLIPAGTPLVCTRMAVGRVAMPTFPVAINQDIKALFPASDVSPDYLLRVLSFARSKAESRAIGSTVKGISIQDYLGIEVPFAPSDEQTAISKVLDTLDTAIQKTEAIIEKLKQVKQGLLHDLLTRGIDENGELRPPQSEAPHLYKESPLGWVPKEWKLASGREVCSEICVGIVVKPVQYYTESGVPVLRSANVRETGLSLDGLVYMSPQNHLLLNKSAVHPGDVLTVRTGYPGTSCVVDDRLADANCVDIIISRPGDEIYPHYWSLWINSPYGKQQVLRVQGGLAQQHFNVGELASMLVAVPYLAEQREIIEKLDNLNSKLGGESLFCAGLGSIKNGLMTDLLSGRVRVTPLLKQ